MTPPFLPVEPLSDVAYTEFRRRAIFDCCKWDPQVGDANVLARYPLVVRRDAWIEVAALAEALAAESTAAEAEIVSRPDLHRKLGLSRGVRRALAAAATDGQTKGVARLVRFDFHFTDDGWRISEANTDVPGGLNEASGFAGLMAPHYPWASPVGDPTRAYVAALAAGCPPGGAAALVHATAYSDDLQMMKFVANALTAAGLRAHLASPAHLRWRDGHAWLETERSRGPLDAVVRFFPGDWLQGLPHDTGWPYLFASGRTAVSNPATAIVTQTKRFPLVWDELATPLPTWRALLPETRDPRRAPWRVNDEWLLKPALGRVGEGVAFAGLVEPREWRASRRAATFWPGAWIAQQRFQSRAAEIAGRAMHVCLGVYTVDGHVAGAYARLAPRPLIDARAEDAAVLAA